MDRSGGRNGEIIFHRAIEILIGGGSGRRGCGTRIGPSAGNYPERGEKIRCNPWNNRQANYRNIFARVNPSWSLSRGPAATCRFHLPLPPDPPFNKSTRTCTIEPRRPPVFNLARALLIRRFFRRPLDPQKPSDANLKATFLKIQRPSRASLPSIARCSSTNSNGFVTQSVRMLRN